MRLTQGYVKELFDYRDDGNLIRKVRRGIFGVGSIVGYKKSSGYHGTMIDGNSYLVSRIIFLWHHGWLPDEVDREDKDTGNNRIGNLRAADHLRNMFNKRKYRNNTSGFKGVTFDKETGKWLARIRINYRNINLGRFPTAEMAYAAYCKAGEELHGKFFCAA